ncbi:hypothetical protein ACTJ2Z_000545 [Vibrio vulnificus]|uniref:hypothetical protein n=1 Tax=Vibrio vulnificus TaxID=672 RepID=UPI001CDC40BA|nr:hypothetical protein [Vibrio vulnificus]MCA3937122.1 hypothetical protein [Vibrio vulnificus]
MAKIRAAKVTVDLEARSAKFTEALDRAQRQAATSSNAINRSLGRLEQASKRFEKNMTDALWRPFHGFKRATAPFKLAIRQIKNIVSNSIRPFKSLARYISGPFVSAFKRAKNGLRTFALSVTGAVAGFTALTVAFSKQSLEMRRWANMLGIGYAELNELQYAAAQFGISNEQLADGMKDLTAKIEDAAYAGSGALLPFFTAINQEATEWQSLSPTEQLLRFSEELSKMDYNTALYWADEVNGAMTEMTPLLHRGAEYFQSMREEAQAFGASIDGVDQIKQIQSVFTRIQYTMRNFFTGVGANLAPIILNAFDSAIARFRAYISQLGDGNEAMGFKRFVNNFTLDVIDTTVAMFRGVDTVINSISSAFDSVTDFLNKLRDLPTFGGKHQLTSRAQTLLTDSQQSYIDNRGRSYNNARRYERLRDEEQAKLDQMDSGRNLFGTITDREAARSYDHQKANVQTYKSMLQQLAVNEGINGILANGDNISSAVLDKYNEAVDKANTVASELNDTASATQSIQEFFLTQRDAIADSNNVTEVSKTPEQQAQEQRAESVRAARSRADNGFRASTQDFGFKGLELGLDAYKAAQQRFIQIQQDSKTTEANIEQQAAEQRVLINAGADRDIAIERSRVYDANNNLLASATDQQVQAVQQAIARINAERETALAGIDVDTDNKRQAVLDKEQVFQNQLLGIRRQFGLEIRNEQELENQVELTQLTSYYDQRLANLETAYSKESELYRQLQQEKAAALEELRTKQQEQQEAEQFAGNGFFDMFNRLTETKANAYAQQESMTKGYTNADLAAAADSEDQKLDIMKASGNQLLAEGAKHNKKLFQLNKSMKIADALMSTYKGMAAAMEWGMPMGPVFAAMVGAQGFLQVNAIRQMQWSGQAHDGIDYVPNTGTWNLETGERVVDKRTNADLKRYLYDNNHNSQQQTANVTVDAGVTVNGNVTDESWFREQLALHREDLAYNMRQASASGYF